MSKDLENGAGRTAQDCICEIKIADDVVPIAYVAVYINNCVLYYASSFSHIFTPAAIR